MTKSVRRQKKLKVKDKSKLKRNVKASYEVTVAANDAINLKECSVETEGDMANAKKIQKKIKKNDKEVTVKKNAKASLDVPIVENDTDKLKEYSVQTEGNMAKSKKKGKKIKKSKNEVTVKKNETKFDNEESIDEVNVTCSSEDYIKNVKQNETTIADAIEIESGNTKQEMYKQKNKIKGKLEQRSEASQNISEFNLTEVGKEKIKLNELIKASQKISSQILVKKQLQNAKKLKSLSIPLSKPQLQKIKRTIAYEKICSDVSKWDAIIKSNRDADQIIFPLKRPEFHLESFETTSERFISKHPVEEAVSEILKTSENVLDKTRTLTAAEEKALQAMSLEEAKLRHGELMRHRALISYKEAKARRQNKIKSKKYHRILKREKLRKIMKEFEVLQKTDKKAALEKFLEADKLRILERMTLKHKNTGKWAKQQKIRAKYNPESRSNLKEDLAIGQQLREKITVKLPTQQEIITEIDPEDKFFEDPSENYLIEDIPFGNTSTDEHTSEKITQLSNILNAEKISGKAKPDEKSTKVKENSTLKPMKTTTLEDEMAFSAEVTCLDSMIPDDITFGDEDVDDKEGGKITINQAFADEEFIAEFQEEKKAADRANKPQGINLFLPGWGTWVGPGTKFSKKKKKKFFIKPIETQPKKNTLGNVIINDEKDKKAAVHQVSHLPFPFSNVHQFQSYIRQPVGHTWNPQSSFQKLIAPKVVTKMGKIIDPIDAEDVVLEKVSHKTQHTRKKKKSFNEVKAF